MAAGQADQWLGKVFEATNRAVQIGNYDGWAATYESDMVGFGYMTPSVVTGTLARFLPPDAGAVLDAGAGTGLVGEILSALGYGDLTAMDMSGGMLARAAQRGVYRELRQGVLGEALDFPTAQFAGCVVCGVFNVGHAPASALGELVRVVRPGGVLSFSIGEAAWHEGSYAAKLADLEAAGRWRKLAQTRPFRSMPLSAAEAMLTSNVFAYQVV